MKKLFLLVISCLMISLTSFTQIAINTDASEPDASSMLDVKSSTRGLLIPRMTTAQRNAVASPAEGLIIYDTDLGSLCIRRSGSWVQATIVPGGSGNTNHVTFWTSPGVLNGSNNLYWDNSNSRLGIGTSSPNQQLEISGAFRFPTTTSSTIGVIYKGSAPFIHNFKPAGRTGCNTFIGENSGNFTMSGSNVWEASSNTTLGYYTLNSNTSGYDNTAIGAFTLENNNSGYNNTAIGSSAMYENTIGYNNTAIGSGVMNNNADGYFNTGCGIDVLFYNTSGDYNTALGAQALMVNKVGSYNTAIGTNALQYDTITNGNTAVGSSALDTYVNGNYNTAVGYHADVSATALTNTVTIGYNTQSNTSNQVRLGNSSISTFYCQGAYAATSSSNPNVTVNSSGQIMRSTAVIPSGTGITNQVAFWSASGVLTGENDLFWDNTNNRLGIGTATPSQKLEVKDGALLISNSSSAGEIRFAEPSAGGSNYTSFKAQTQASNITYTLPAADGTSGNVLSTNGSGTLSWATNYTGDITAVGSMTTGNVFADATADNNWLGLGASAGRIEFDDQATDEVNILNANVGIGTATPNQQLEITGNFRLPVTTATTGTIYSGAIPFLHNYGTYNVFLGGLSGNLTLSGAVDNTGIGDSTLYSITGGDYNVAIGTSALKSLTGGDGHVVIGARAGMALTDPTSGGYSTIIGFQAGRVTTADRNTFIGCESGLFNTTGFYNVFLGHQSGYHNTTGNYSTALGFRALYSQTGNSTDNSLNNTAVGYEAMYSNNPTSSSNGRENVAIGYQSLRQNQTGYHNTSVGTGALYTNSTGNFNTAVGRYALYNATASNNTAVGDGALQFLSSGQHNTAVGTYALDQITTGWDNTTIGYLANCDDYNCSNSVAIGYSASASGSDEVRLGNSSIQSLFCTGAYNGTIGTTNRDLYADNTGKIGYIASSARYKNNITDMEKVDWLYKLRPVNFTYKSDGTAKKQYGLIAEEVEKVNPDFVSYNTDGSAETVSYSQMIAPMLKAIQDQQALIEELQKRIETLEANEPK
jgi:trimeric autotransporter adhesin